MPTVPELPATFTLDDVAILLVIALIVAVAYFVARGLLTTLGIRFIARFNARLATYFSRARVLPAVALLMPAIVIAVAEPWIRQRLGWAGIFIDQLLSAYSVLVIGLTLYRALNMLDAWFSNEHQFANAAALKSLFHWLRVGCVTVVTLLALGAFANIQVTSLLTWVGVIIAAGSIVFGDLIYNAVSRLILKGRELVMEGDWLEIPELQINGKVKMVGAQLIEIQNWDNSLATVTPRYLLTNTFRNWQNMQKVGTRRILRYLYLDVTTVRPLDDELRQATHSLPGIAKYLDQQLGVATLTNVALYRAYLTHYLATHPKVAQEFTLRVTNEDATGRGLPLLIVAYLTETSDIPYRLVDAEIYEHALALAPRFGLRLFQFAAAPMPESAPAHTF